MTEASVEGVDEDEDGASGFVGAEHPEVAVTDATRMTKYHEAWGRLGSGMDRGFDGSNPSKPLWSSRSAILSEKGILADAGRNQRPRFVASLTAIWILGLTHAASGPAFVATGSRPPQIGPRHGGMLREKNQLHAIHRKDVQLVVYAATDVGPIMPLPPPTIFHIDGEPPWLDFAIPILAAASSESNALARFPHVYVCAGAKVLRADSNGLRRIVPHVHNDDQGVIRDLRRPHELFSPKAAAKDGGNHDQPQPHQGRAEAGTTPP